MSLKCSSAPGIVAHNVWLGNQLPGPRLDYSNSLALAEKAEHSYCDAHCWVLTPDSFSALMRSAADAQLTDFQFWDVRHTIPGGMDFSAVLREERH
jgi:hypothetical protein